MEREDIRALLADTKGLGAFRQTTGTVTVAFLPGLDLPVMFEPENVGADDVASVVHNLTRIDSSVRPKIAELIHAACLESFEECDCDFESPQAQLDWEAETTGAFVDPKVPHGSADIWALVRFTGISVEARQHHPFAGSRLAIIGGQAAWDGEHGIGLVFDEGKDLIHIGDSNGL